MKTTTSTAVIIGTLATGGYVYGYSQLEPTTKEEIVKTSLSALKILEIRKGDMDELLDGLGVMCFGSCEGDENSKQVSGLIPEVKEALEQALAKGLVNNGISNQEKCIAEINASDGLKSNSVNISCSESDFGSKAVISLDTNGGVLQVNAYNGENCKIDSSVYNPVFSKYIKKETTDETCLVERDIQGKLLDSNHNGERLNNDEISISGITIKFDRTGLEEGAFKIILYTGTGKVGEIEVNKGDNTNEAATEIEVILTSVYNQRRAEFRKYLLKGQPRLWTKANKDGTISLHKKNIASIEGYKIIVKDEDGEVIYKANCITKSPEDIINAIAALYE